MSADQVRDEFAFLDSVRGLAAVVVVVWHLLLGFYPSLADPALPPWIRVWYSGGFAVQLFFTLSGFVLSLSFVRGGGIESLQSAAVRRYFRLTVPILASVLLSYFLHRLGLYFNREVAAYSGQSSDSWMGTWFGFPASLPRAIDEGLYRATFAHDMERTYNNVLWTMQMEFAGSLFVFSFLALFGKMRNRWIVYVAVGAVLTRQGWVWSSGFLAGIALSDLLGGRIPVCNRPVMGTILVLAGLFLGGMTPDWVRELAGWIPKRLLVFPSAAGGMLLLYGVIHTGWLQVVLRTRPLMFLGQISFPLYLVHVPIELSLGCYVYLVCSVAGCAPGAGFVAAASATIVASLMVAWVGAIAIEPFSINLGRKVYQSLFRPSLTAEQPRPSGRCRRWWRRRRSGQ